MSRSFCIFLCQTFVIAMAVAVGGCAYRMGHLERRLPGGYDRVAVPVFSNKTVETGVETYFTNALIEEFHRSRMAEVVNKNDAQIILEGTVSKILYEGTQVSANDDVIKESTYQGTAGTDSGLPAEVVLTKEYRLYVTVHLVARRVSDNTVMWDSDVDGVKRYQAPLIFNQAISESNAVYNSSAREQTISKMAIDMMSEAHDRLVENF